MQWILVAYLKKTKPLVKFLDHSWQAAILTSEAKKTQIEVYSLYAWNDKLAMLNKIWKTKEKSRGLQKLLKRSLTNFGCK